MTFKSELNDFFKTKFMKIAISIYDYYVIVSVLFFNFLIFHNLLPCKKFSSLLVIVFLSITIYFILPNIYLYFLKNSVYKNNLQISDNFYIDNISLETFKHNHSIYCKEYDSIIILAIVRPSKFKYKSKVFLINKLDITDNHIKILSEFYKPLYAKRCP